MKLVSCVVVFMVLLSFSIVGAQEQPQLPQQAPQTEEPAPQAQAQAAKPSEYKLGVGDVVEISVLQPEKMVNLYTVAPDGTITFPYIGNVQLKGMLLETAQGEIQSRLADGYMKYPVVSVTLRESRSRKFSVYGEVARPGTYPLDDNTTALKAISTAGGFTKFGSTSRVKILRPYKDKEGYETIKVNMNAAMGGKANKDVVIEPDDIVVVEEGLF